MEAESSRVAAESPRVAADPSRIGDLAQMPPLPPAEGARLLSAAAGVRRIAQHIKERQHAVSLRYLGAANAKGGAAPRADDNPETLVLRVEVPEGCVGGLVGHQGDGLRRIERVAQCRVQLGPAAGDTRTVIIEGLPDDVASARAMVDEAVREMLAGRPDGPAQTPRRTVLIPHAAVGIVIGRSGANARDISAKTGARIRVSTDESGEAREVLVFADSDAAADAAAELVREAASRVQDARRAPAAHLPNTARAATRIVVVPEHAVGLLIGRKGDALRSVQALSGCRVFVDPAPTEVGHVPGAAPPGMRAVRVFGTPEQAAAAEALIRERTSKAIPPRGGYAPQQPYYPQAGAYPHAGAYAPAPYQSDDRPLPPYYPQAANSDSRPLPAYYPQAAPSDSRPLPPYYPQASGYPGDAGQRPGPPAGAPAGQPAGFDYAQYYYQYYYQSQQQPPGGRP